MITIYQGKVGLRTATNKMLESNEILAYGGRKNADNIFGSYTPNFVQKRVEKIILNSIIGHFIPEHMVASSIKKIYAY